MRKIIFRGKMAYGNEFVYGYFAKACKFGEKRERSYILKVIDRREHGLNAIEIEVDPATVGQYTGLKDKHGQRIFEGDVCKIRIPLISGGLNQHIASCSFGDGSFWFVSNDGEWWRGNDYGYPDTANKNIEIIGNIHDNPELLEASK